MTKIDELIDLISNATDEFYADGDQEFYRVDIERIMKEYAEYYANKCLALIYHLPQEIPFECFQLPEHE